MEINSLIITGLIVGFAGIIVMNIKQIINTIYKHFMNMFVYTIRIDEASQFFYVVQKYVLNEKKHKIKNFYYRNIYDDFISGEDRQYSLLFNYGFMIIRYGGKFLILNKINETIQNTMTPYKNQKQSIGIYGFSGKAVQDFITDINAKYGNDSLKYYFNNDGEIKVLNNVPSKTFDNIFLNDDLNQKIRKDLDGFIGAKHLYETMGLKYKRTYCFYGRAGTGKSSLIAAIANYTKREVLSINLSKGMTDSTLIKLVANRPKGAIVAFEDIDCLFDELKRGDDATSAPADAEKIKITLSCVLNILDGSYTPNDVIFVLTTNHIDKLDDALKRDGRTDVLLEIGTPNLETKKRYLKYIQSLKGDIDVDINDDITLSSLQKYIVN